MKIAALISLISFVICACYFVIRAAYASAYPSSINLDKLRKEFFVVLLIFIATMISLILFTFIYLSKS